MKKRFAGILLSALLLSICAQAQMTTIAASHLSYNGELVPSATLCFAATGIPSAGFHVGSTGQISGQGVCRDVVNGVIQSTLHGKTLGLFQVADVSLSDPVNVCYNATMTDPAGRLLLGTPNGQYSGYSCIQPSGATFDFDAYVPSITPNPLGFSATDFSIENLTVQNCTGCGTGEGSSITLKTNGSDNSSQDTFNLQNGSGTTVSNPGGGNVQVNTTYGSSSGTAAQGNDARIVGAEQAANKGAANGYAPLDGSSDVPLANIPALPESKTTNLVSDLAAKEVAANKGTANGYAPLDGSSDVPLGNIPALPESQITNLPSDLAALIVPIPGSVHDLICNGGASFVACDTGVIFYSSSALTVPALHISGAWPGNTAWGAGVGSVPALPANSAGFAGPNTGGTSYLFKFSSTWTAGVLFGAAPGTSDGVNESALSPIAVSTTPAANALPQADSNGTLVGFKVPYIGWSSAFTFTELATGPTAGSAANIFSPSADGNYALEISMGITSAGSGGTCTTGAVGVFVGWRNRDTGGTSTAGTGTNVPLVASNSNAALTTCTLASITTVSCSSIGPVYVDAKAGTNISITPIQTTANNCTSTPVVTIRYTLQQVSN